MSKLKIEEFVEKHFGIKLLPQQLEMIAMMAANPEKQFVIQSNGRSAGKTTAYKAAMAYLQDGMKPVELEKISNVDPGELLLEAAKNAQHIAPELQRSAARFMDIWSSPVMTIKPTKIDLEDIKR